MRKELMMNLRNGLAMALVAGLLVTAGRTQAMAGVVIDEFETPTAGVVNSSNTPEAFALTPADSDVFDVRNVSVTDNGSANFGGGQVMESSFLGAGSVTLEYFNGTVAGGVATPDGSTSNLEGTTTPLADRFFVTFNSVFDLGGGSPDFTLTVDGDEFTTSLATSGPSVLAIPFSAFPNVVFTAVTSVTALIEFAGAGTVNIASITTGVPEPSTVIVWSMISAAGLGLAYYRRSSPAGMA